MGMNGPEDHTTTEDGLQTATIRTSTTPDGSRSSTRSEPLSPEAIADRLVPLDPRISPNGTKVVFVAEPGGQKEKKTKRALWIADGHQAARPLTAGVWDDRGPRWSPDGSRILFVSDRLEVDEEGSRLFLLPAAGGEGLPLGDLQGSLSEPSWSPDGRYVCALREDPEPDSLKTRKKARDDAIVIEEDPRFTRLWAIDVATGRARCLTTGSREIRAYAWAPDGDALVFISTDMTGIDAQLGPSDLWEAPLAGGLPLHVSRFRSTGSSLLVVTTADEARVVVKIDGHREEPSDSIWTVPLSGGVPRNLLPNLNGNVEEMAFFPGRSGAIVARVVERTHGRLYAVDVVTGEMESISPPSLLEKGSILHGVSLSPDGKRMAAIWSNATTPEEVFLGDVGGAAAPVSSFGAQFAGRLQPTEHVTWLSDDGTEIEGLLTYPAGYKPGHRYPLIVEIHGGPSWQWEDRVMLDWHDWAQMLASHGYAVLLPNPRGSTGYGNAFQKMLQDDVGGGESKDLISGALAMVDRGIADRARLGIGGWSWGGYLTAWTITQTDIFSAAVMGAGLSNMISDHGQGDIPTANLLYYPGQPYDNQDAYWKSSPIRYVADVRTPTLILHGDEDARVHPAQGMEYFRALKILGVPVRFVRYPREKHGIRERAHQIDLMNRVVEWFDRYLKPSPAPGSKGAADA